MTDTFRTRHKVSGVIDENTPENIVNHAVFGAYLEVVGPDAKPYLPEMHRVSLPKNPTPDQIKVAESVGLIPETAAELKATVAAERAKADDKIGKN
jgi:hypothetical protein